MNNELLHIVRKHTDTLIEQTKAKPQESLKSKLKKQMEIFSFIRSINPSKDGKCFLAVKMFAATNSVFNITDENNSFYI